jgi:hypothetical protein
MRAYHSPQFTVLLSHLAKTVSKILVFKIIFMLSSFFSQPGDGPAFPPASEVCLQPSLPGAYDMKLFLHRH